MDWSVVCIVCVFAIIGLTLLVGGLTRAKWLMVDNNDWWMLDTRKAVRRFWGDKGLQIYSIAVGALLFLGAAISLMVYWPH
jgi:hypothetical protein